MNFAQTALSADTLPPLSEADPAPVVLSREEQFEFKSEITGREYRLMIATPYGMEAEQTYPVVYILDGYWYYRPAVDYVTEAGERLDKAVIVGVSYPTEDYDEHCKRRWIDMGIPPLPEDLNPEDEHREDGDTFIRALNEEIKPFVEARYPVDVEQQALYGKSLGGLLVLRQMLREPDAFQTYIAASPATFIFNFAVLADEPAFTEKVKNGDVNLRLLITTAEGDQYRGEDPEKLKWANKSRMVDSARELSERLQGLDSEKVEVEYVYFPGESHFSVSLACLGRGLAFALPPDAKE
ncbi:alpha/beta hydrolase [Cerasicoccus frondis]|uniref:alpha/beta hydrolase n=1 Tax=Cerasicoccus frondis TaxID=490090 RepID=UPI0028526E07|nr:alpha/beta hydrolase-fold protein [Cerasicoccus frondis]